MILASIDPTTRRNSAVCHSAILSPVRYEQSNVTATTWTYTRNRRGLAAPPVNATTAAR
jgi:hypothetical protein